MMGYAGAGLMGAWGWLWMLAGLLFWVGVVVLVVWGAAALFGRRGDAAEPDALELLRRRYARGEISEAEFERARRTIA
jgi:putative membrane protein